MILFGRAEEEMYLQTLVVLFMCVHIISIAEGNLNSTSISQVQRRRLQRPKPRATLDSFLTKAGISMNNMLDIGANKGDFTRTMLKIFPTLNSIMIEGNKEHMINWQDIKRGKGYIGILSSKSEEKTWYRNVDEPSTGDSLYRETSTFGSKMTGIVVNTFSLDDFITKNGITTKFDFIKIDVQGAELEILHGGKETLKNVKAILLELPFFGVYNEGSPDFVEYISYMKDIGYLAYEITEMHSMRSYLMQVDILFLQKNIYTQLSQRAIPK